MVASSATLVSATNTNAMMLMLVLGRCSMTTTAVELSKHVVLNTYFVSAWPQPPINPSRVCA
jgi:hypothetical protein